MINFHLKIYAFLFLIDTFYFVRKSKNFSYNYSMTQTCSALFYYYSNETATNRVCYERERRV